MGEPSSTFQFWIWDGAKYCRVFENPELTVTLAPDDLSPPMWMGNADFEFVVPMPRQKLLSGILGWKSHIRWKQMSKALKLYLRGRKK